MWLLKKCIWYMHVNQQRLDSVYYINNEHSTIIHTVSLEHYFQDSFVFCVMVALKSSAAARVCKSSFSSFSGYEVTRV